MGKQLHTRFSTQEVIEILRKYIDSEIELEIALRLLKIQRRQFFNLLKDYKDDPSNFDIGYERKKTTRKIDKKTEHALQNELQKEQGLIENKNTSVKTYNYSYVQKRLREKQGIEVSLPTIINRAKKMVFTNKNSRKKATIEKC